MSLASGRTLSHYRLVEKIGEGGMGVVWKATDSTLGREVAIKVLPESLMADPERTARFEREARLLASLNHTNVASVYGFHEAEGVRFLAMELAEGESLAARLERGVVPAGEVVAIARQIAEALEAAHERGVIHRDLKPGNVMVGPDGKVKVLDFGLAKALEGERAAPSGINLTQSPTITAAMTSANVILGTAAYMSPEQARGQAVDRRADIWAFGVIVYEMLTGRRLFHGETVSDTLAAVLRAEPEWSELPSDTPARLRRLIERCLTRDPRQRLRDIGEARIALDLIASGAADETIAAQAAAPVVAVSPLRLGLIAAGGLVVGLVAMAAIGGVMSKPSEPPLRRFAVAGRDSAGTSPASPVISPDGRSIAFVRGTTLWLQSLDALEAEPLVAAPGLASPFWSPDGQQVGYIVGSRLMRVSVGGGEPQTITDARKPFTNGSGATWREDGIVVSSRAELDGIMEVPALGGDPTVVLPPDTTSESDFHEPHALPGGRGVIFVTHRNQGFDTIELLARGKRKVLFQLEGQSLYDPVYSQTGHILFRRSPQNSGIWALPFSLDRLEATGAPFLVAPAGSYPSVASDGTMVFRAGGGSGVRQLAWVDRDGRDIATIGEPEEGLERFTGPAIAPDGVRVVIGQEIESQTDIWIFDTVRGTKTRLTFEPGGEYDPVWTPDGSRIVYAATSPECNTYGCRQLLVRAADGTGVPDTITAGSIPAVSPDGSQVVFTTVTTGTDIGTAPLKGGVATVLIREDEVQFTGRVSPNGNYFAYVSFETGRPEIYLKRYPSWGGKWQVSTSGGTWPRWNGKGDRLYYTNGDDFYEVEVTGGASPSLGAPRKLFSLRSTARTFRNMPAGFDVTADGQRFVVLRPAGASGEGGQVVAVQSWFSAFRDQMK